MPKILESAVRQIKKKGGAREPYAVATAGLQKAGVLKKGTQKLTKKGQRRNAMTAQARARTRKLKPIRGLEDADDRAREMLKGAKGKK